jgi:hypothetical protein
MGVLCIHKFPFGLKNSPAVFSQIVVTTFKEFIHKFLEVYLDDWTVFSLLKEHMQALRLMLDRCHQLQISLNLKKCIFVHPLAHCWAMSCAKDGLLVDQAKIVSILDMVAPTSVREMCATLGHTGYYRWFIQNYAQIAAPLEKLLHKDTKYEWTPECQKALDTLKEKLVTTPILVFPDWSKLFHVHVDASSIALGAFFLHNREGNIDHPIYFSSRKLSDAKNNYTTTKHEGLAMVYALHKFHHYLLGSAFKFFTDHSVLKYLVNKLVLGGQIFHWLFLFQEFDFEVVVKSGKYNVGPDHLSWIETGEAAKSLDDELPDAQLFWVEVVPDQLAKIVEFLMTGQAPTRYTLVQHRQLVTHSADYQLIVRQLYKLGTDGILCRCAIEHE